MLMDALRTTVRHYKEGNFNWPMIIYLVLIHASAVTGLFYLQSAHANTLLWAFILWPISGLGITAGVHRLWAHRSYDATFALRVILMLFNSIANQGSIWHWSRDHRVHHKHSETDADPHNATRGFFFAHMGWLVIKKHKDIVVAGKKLNFDDLRNDVTVMFQKNLDPWFALFMCFVMPGLVCTLWGDNFWTGFYVAGGLRYVAVLHFTWLVNSAAHLYGDHPYDPKSWPAENPVVSLLSIGEGWHNWHHKYPFDYAASEFGIDKQFNPTKLFLDFCIAVGLASNPKRATGAWHKLREKREIEIYGDKNAGASAQEDHLKVN
jgi:stearoyl-CoA desaturase (delta-9 desaturase)